MSSDSLEMEYKMGSVFEPIIKYITSSHTCRYSRHRLPTPTANTGKLLKYSFISTNFLFFSY